MRFYTSARRFYRGVNLHARTKGEARDVGGGATIACSPLAPLILDPLPEPVALTGRLGGTDEFLGRGARPAAVPALGKSAGA